MTTVLVTGGAGYVGSHAVYALRQRGFEVVIVDDLSTGRRALVPNDATFYDGNAGDMELIGGLIRAHGCTAALHFAGSIVNPESFEVPLAYYANNVTVSRNLIEACVAGGVDCLIFSSSAAVYGAPDEIPVDETAPLAPISPYGRSKLMTEWMLADAAAATDLRYAALRYFNVAGADAAGRSGQVGPATHLIKIAAETAVGARPKMTIFGDDYPTPDGTCIRDYVHVSDLADAHALALEYLLAGGASTALNCGYGHGFSVREVVDAVARISGENLNVEIGPRRIGDPPALVGDAAKIKRDWGWDAKFDDLDAIIASALDWERRQRTEGASS